MMKPGSLLKRISLMVGLGLMTMTNSGCILGAMTGFGLMAGLMYDAFQLSGFFGTTPLIPVSPYYSELIEDAYIREERYDKVPVLDRFLSQYPETNGYPHVYILDSDGTFLHSQDTAELEDGEASYVPEVFMAFLQEWAPVK